MSEEMVKAQTQEIATFDFDGDEGRGFEHQSKADISIPMIVLLQFMSPQVTKRVAGSNGRVAQAGDFMNTVTNEVIDGTVGFLFVPATTRHMYAKWVPRGDGGGFRGHLMPEDPVVEAARVEAEKRRLADPKARFGKLETEDGLQLVETFYVYGALSTEDGEAAGMAMLAFSSTKIAVYRKWQTRLAGVRVRNSAGKSVRPPLFTHLTRITSSLESNDLGDFFVPAITTADPRGIMNSMLRADDDRYQMAKSALQMMESGDAKVNYDAEQASAPDQENSPY